MKVLVNESKLTVLFNMGRTRIMPKGMPGDRVEVSDKFAEDPKVQRMVAAKKISVLSVEEVAKLDASKVVATEAPTTASVQTAEESSPSSPPPVVSEAAPAPESAPAPEGTPDGGEPNEGGGRKRRFRG